VNIPKDFQGDIGGMNGQVIQIPLTKKQQKSQTIHNYIKFLDEFYEDFEIQPNFLQGFYPK
jgi:hypothetical protein